MTVAIRNISLSFNGNNGSREQIFDDFSLDLDQGEFVCLLGPSGCGKSTLLGMIAGFVRPESGSLEVSGKSVERPDLNRTLVFQEYALFPWLNVIENVAFGLEHKVKDKQERYMLAARYLKMVGLLKQARQSVASLSGGMKQRVALARALVVKPDLLLMDEPFAALDNQTRFSMRSELTRIWQEQNQELAIQSKKQGVVFVTHSVDEALVMADRVIVMGRPNGSSSAAIKADIKVDAERPRSLACPELSALRIQIMDALTERTPQQDSYIYDVGL